RFRFECELPSRIAPVLCRVGGTVHAKLLKIIHRNESLRSAQCGRSRHRPTDTRTSNHGFTGSRPHIGAHTVNGVIVRLCTLAIHAELAALAKPRAKRTVQLGRLCHNSRWKQNQILEAPAIQRHVLDVGLIDDGTDRPIRSIDVQATSFYRYALRYRPNLKSKVLLDVILDVDDQ